MALTWLDSASEYDDFNSAGAATADLAGLVPLVASRARDLVARPPRVAFVPFDEPAGEGGAESGAGADAAPPRLPTAAGSERHSHFVQVSHRLAPELQPSFGEQAVFEVKRYGDLVGPAWLELDLPLLLPDGSAVTYCNGVGWAAVKLAEFMIGGRVVDAMSGRLMYELWARETDPGRREAEVAQLGAMFRPDPARVGGFDEYADVMRKTQAFSVRDGGGGTCRRLRIPLMFPWCRHHEQRIALAALRKTELYVRVTLAPLREIVSIVDTLTMPALPAADVSLLVPTSKLAVWLVTEYTWLTPAEREAVAATARSDLYLQTQHVVTHEFDAPTSVTALPRIDIARRVKNLLAQVLWDVQPRGNRFSRPMETCAYALGVTIRHVVPTVDAAWTLNGAPYPAHAESGVYHATMDSRGKCAGRTDARLGEAVCSRTFGLDAGAGAHTGSLNVSAVDSFVLTLRAGGMHVTVRPDYETMELTVRLDATLVQNAAFLSPGTNDTNSPYIDFQLGALSFPCLRLPTFDAGPFPKTGAMSTGLFGGDVRQHPLWQFRRPGTEVIEVYDITHRLGSSVESIGYRDDNWWTGKFRLYGLHPAFVVASASGVWPAQVVIHPTAGPPTYHSRQTRNAFVSYQLKAGRPQVSGGILTVWARSWNVLQYGGGLAVMGYDHFT